MTIAPIIHSVHVPVAPARAFELFTQRISEWWPVKCTVGVKPHVSITIEPRENGKWAERDEDGVETQWGRIIAWQPPSRILFGWQLSSEWKHDPSVETEVELTFTATASGTEVRVEHRNLERLGKDAAVTAEQLNGGWPTRLADFAAFVKVPA